MAKGLSPIDTSSSAMDTILSVGQRSTKVLSPTREDGVSPASVSSLSEMVTFPPLVTHAIVLPFVFRDTSGTLTLLPSVAALVAARDTVTAGAPARSEGSTSPPIALQAVFATDTVDPTTVDVGDVNSITTSRDLLDGRSYFFHMDRFSPCFTLFSTTLSFIDPIYKFRPGSLDGSSLLLGGSLVFSSYPTGPIGFLRVGGLARNVIPYVDRGGGSLYASTRTLCLPTIYVDLIGWNGPSRGNRSISLPRVLGLVHGLLPRQTFGLYNGVGVGPYN